MSAARGTAASRGGTDDRHTFYPLGGADGSTGDDCSVMVGRFLSLTHRRRYAFTSTGCRHSPAVQERIDRHGRGVNISPCTLLHRRRQCSHFPARAMTPAIETTNAERTRTDRIPFSVTVALRCVPSRPCECYMT